MEEGLFAMRTLGLYITNTVLKLLYVYPPQTEDTSLKPNQRSA